MAKGYCFLCHKWRNLEEHHIFGGPYRDKSTKYKLTVDLCWECHRTGPEAAHRCRETREQLQEYGQRKAMREQGWSVEDFIREFGKNHIP